MKKIAILLFFVSAMNASMLAQDTIVANSPKDIYFYTPWIERDTVILTSDAILRDQFDEAAYAFHTSDTLQIYGLTISLQPQRHFSEYYYIDSTMDSLYSMVRLYEPNGTNNLRVIGEKCVHLRDSAIAYYLQLTQLNAHYYDPNIPLPPIPVYELYFDHPVTVFDTFYVGYTFERGTWDAETNTSTYKYCFALKGFQDGNERRPVKEPWVFGYHKTNNDTVNPWRFYSSICEPHRFLYAIIAPRDTTVTPIDTIVNPGDSLAIKPNDLIYRYTNVAPNPARNSVRITSSFGISRIEAYDLRGRRIYESPQLSTFSFPLSTIDWPRGTYLLRITTPAGPTTKKLLIQ